MVNKGDIVEIKYTGYIDGKIFDTTDKTIDNKNNISKVEGPVIIIVGEGFILRGLDNSLIGKNVGEKYVINLSPKDAFGLRNPKLVRIMSLSDFKKHRINPTPGMTLNIDGMICTIKSVSSGRVIVDFNHPLAGKKIKYTVEIIKKISDPKQKIKGILHFFGIKDYSFDDKKLIIQEKTNNFQREYLKNLFNKYFKGLEMSFK